MVTNALPYLIVGSNWLLYQRVKPQLDKSAIMFSNNTKNDVRESMLHQLALQKKYTSVMIRVCHSRSHFLSCMYIHDDLMTESR